MSRTIDFDELEWAGAMAVRFLDVTVDSYSTGGEDFTVDDAGMDRIQRVIPQVVDGSAYTAQYDRTSDSIRLFSGGSEAATDGTVTGVELEVTVIGRT